MSARPGSLPNQEALLTAHLSLCVPLRIDELRRSGGATSDDFARVSCYAHDLGEAGDQLFFRGKRTTELFNKLVDAVAVLAHVPGGISLFGLHFEVKP